MRAQVVLLRDDPERAGREQILLACHRRSEGDYWVLPGGSVEDGESPEEAAVREVREEAGLEIEVEQLLFVDRPRSRPGITVSSPRYTFLGRVVGGELRRVEEREAGRPGKGYLAGAIWMPWESEAYDAATRDTLRLVRDALSREI